MTLFLPVVDVVLCAKRLEMIFPRAAFDTVLSNPLAAAGVAALIYVGAVQGEPGETQPRYARPSMVMWLNDEALAMSSDANREDWYRAALNSKKRVAALESAGWNVVFNQRYADNTRETLRDETFPGWRELGAVVSRAGLATSSSSPRWALTRSFADLFNPGLSDQSLTDAIDDWTQKYMSTAGKLKALSAREMATSKHSVDVVLPNGEHRQLEPGTASRILKAVIEEWAPRKLVEPLVLTISEPGDKVYVADKKRLAGVGIEIDVSRVLPDALVVDAASEPLQFWIIEAVATDGEIDEVRKSNLLEWASKQGIPAQHCEFMTAFTSRNSVPAKRRLKDLAAGTFAWFIDEPDFELRWSGIESNPRPNLAVVTPLRG